MNNFDAVNPVSAEDIIADEEELIENDGKYWAGRVTDVLEQTDQEVEPVEALETLAILDAEHSITDHYDPDEMDLFLDEFQEAVEDTEEKEDILEDHIKEAKKDDATPAKKDDSDDKTPKEE